MAMNTRCLRLTLVALMGARLAAAAENSNGDPDANLTEPETRLTRSALKACLDRDSDAEVLSCARAAVAVRPAQLPQTTNAADGKPAASSQDAKPAATEPESYLLATFKDQWALRLRADNSDCHRSLCAYRPSYLIARHSDSPNTWPSSSAPGRSVTAPVSALPMEAKFQISFKTLAHEWDGNRWQFWLAYTQQNQWQVFNSLVSRPFRETNYEPEVFLQRRWEEGMPGYAQGLRFVGLSLNHQSNGQSNPLSRSWNRVIVQAGFAWNKWTAVGKVWQRVREDAENDDNPHIENYLGRGELTLNWAPDWKLFSKSVWSMRLRHSLNRSQPHGSVQLEWAIPFAHAPKYRFFLQAFRGYGESMIDYNHAQTTFGMGLGLMDW